MSNRPQASKDTFNILLNDLPVSYRGVKIRTDFKQGLKFFRILSSDRFTDEQKPRLIISALLEEFPHGADPQEVLDYLIEYISGGNKPMEEDSKQERVFDWNVDVELVYAAFMQVYRIDLLNEEMHWWKFLALFNGLPDGTKLSQIIEIRGKDIPKNADAKYKARLTELKERFALDVEELHERQANAADNFF